MLVGEGALARTARTAHGGGVPSGHCAFKWPVAQTARRKTRVAARPRASSGRARIRAETKPAVGGLGSGDPKVVVTA